MNTLLFMNDYFSAWVVGTFGCAGIWILLGRWIEYKRIKKYLLNKKMLNDKLEDKINMKALRLGNWLALDNSTLVRVNELPYPITNCKYVEITESWLVNFGFMSVSSKGKLWFKWKIQSPQGYLYLDEFFQPISNGIQVAHCHIFCVHELQNILFALTGYELRISNELDLVENPEKYIKGL